MAAQQRGEQPDPNAFPGQQSDDTGADDGASPAPDDQGDGTDGRVSASADDVSVGRQGQSDHEGQGGYGNDTGYTGGTVGSRDTPEPDAGHDRTGSDRAAGGMA